MRRSGSSPSQADVPAAVRKVREALPSRREETFSCSTGAEPGLLLGEGQEGVKRLGCSTEGTLRRKGRGTVAQPPGTGRDPSRPRQRPRWQPTGEGTGSKANPIAVSPRKG